MVGGIDKQIYLPNKLTEALGYFKDENLDVTLIDEPSGVSSEIAVASGQVELGSGSYDHTIDLQSQGKLITSVAQLLAEPGEWVMVSKQKASTIKTPADWVGASAGVTSNRRPGTTARLATTCVRMRGLPPKETKSLMLQGSTESTTPRVLGLSITPQFVCVP